MTEVQQAPRPTLFFWSMFIIAAAGVCLSPVWIVDLLLHPLNSTGFLPYPLLNLMSGFVIGPITIAVGLLILRRQPRNVVAVLIVVIGQSWIANTLRSDLNVTWITAINYSFGGIVWIALFLMVPYFPDGRMYPPRYARLVHSIALYFVIFGTLTIFMDRTLPVGGLNPSTIENPFFIPALQGIRAVNQPFGTVFILGLIGLGLFSLIRRFQDGDQLTRRRILWLIWNMVLFAGFVVVGFGFNLYSYQNPLTTVFSIVFYTWLGLFPLIGIGYAILRHKLYDIDIIIRRTLIYTVLTTILGVVYFGGIVLTQQVFRAITGQSSELAIVVSTLLIAALFAAVRRRVQDVIDRRLYRKKYDAEKVLADFQKNLRDEVDMETLKANLIGVLDDTMQPTRIALWVKEPKS